MEFKIIVIGASLGVLRVIRKLLAALPSTLPAAVVVVLHRDSASDASAAELLQRWSLLPVAEPEDKEPILPGRLYLAQAGVHLLINNGYFSVSGEEPVRFARPSIDLLFESAADTFGDRTIGVIMTGANADGAAGLAAIRENGGFTIAQAPETAECPIMPQAAIDAHAVNYIATLEEIGPLLVRMTG